MMKVFFLHILSMLQELGDMLHKIYIYCMIFNRGFGQNNTYQKLSWRISNFSKIKSRLRMIPSILSKDVIEINSPRMI